MTNFLSRVKSILVRLKVIKHITAQITYRNPSQLLRDKKIIITGGNRGIGLAMAKNLYLKGLKSSYRIVMKIP